MAAEYGAKIIVIAEVLRLPLIYQSSDKQYKMTECEKSQIICVVCGKAIINEQRKEKAEIINGTSYTFDSNECVLMFKKFRAVYGSDFI